MLNSRYRIIPVVLASFILFTSACSDESVSHDEPDITGTWSGSFTGNDGSSFSLILNIESQYTDPDNHHNELLSGTWSSPNAWIDGGAVSGNITSAHISDSRVTVLLEKSTGSVCYYKIRFSGYLNTTNTGYSLTDSGATYMHQCTTSSGTMELVH